MKKIKRVGIIVFIAVIVFSMTSCPMEEEKCDICGGSVTFLVTHGEATNKVIITMSSGEWKEEDESDGSYKIRHFYNSLDLTETYQDPQNGVESWKSWTSNVSESSNISINILQDKSKLELTFHTNESEVLDGSWRGLLEIDEFLLSYTNHERFLHDKEFIGLPIVVEIMGSDTKPN